MSTATVALRTSARERLEAGWILAQRHRVLWPAAGLLVATTIAYHFTLSSLFDYLRLDTPLAYLPLLPFFTLWLALSSARRYRDTPPPIADRQVDLIIGIPLAFVALAMITVLPALSSTYYWTDRPDVLSLAIFVSAGIIVLYGVNWFWRVRASIVFLLLMWPAIYIHFMAGLLQSFSDATNRVLGSVVAHVPLGITSGGRADLLVLHPHGGSAIEVAVGSACSGANSVLGFALIGGALMTSNGGRRWAKFAWLVVGLGLVFLLNILRLTSIFGLATLGHPTLALGGYHAVIGLILFAVAVALMMRAMPLFGIRPRDPLPAATASGRAPGRPRSAPSTRRTVAMWSGIAVLVGFVALADHELLPYASFLDGTGAPTVESFGQAKLPTGVQVAYTEPPYDWAKQYFGANSTFQRHYVRDGGATTVFADVVRTDDRGALDAYGLQNCFLFHNYDIRTARRLDLGNGVTGLLLNYSDPNTHARWATVSWAWPVRYSGDTFYERVALTADLNANGATASDANFEPDGSGLHGLVLSLLNHTAGSTDDPAVRELYRGADTRLEELSTRIVRSSVQGTTS